MTKVLLLLCTSVVAFGAFVLAGPGGGESTEPLRANVPAVTIPVFAAERLAGSLRIPTVSSEARAAFDAAAFDAFHVYLQSSFPRVHEELRREKVAQHSVLYTWQGSDSSLDPILLMGHLDVVPVEAASGAQWQHDPFGGRVVDGYIWGRGAIDNKSTVMGTLEAVEMLLQEGFRPARTVYPAYGHDEEVGGTHGAREIAALLKARGVELEMVLDEGGVVATVSCPASHHRLPWSESQRRLSECRAQHTNPRRALLAAARGDSHRNPQCCSDQARAGTNGGKIGRPDARTVRRRGTALSTGAASCLRQPLADTQARSAAATREPQHERHGAHHVCPDPLRGWHQG